MEGDFSIRELFRIVFLQGGQILIGTLIGSGVLLLVGILGVLLSPVLVPGLLIWHYRRRRAERLQAASGGGGPPAAGL